MAGTSAQDKEMPYSMMIVYLLLRVKIGSDSIKKTSYKNPNG